MAIKKAALGSRWASGTDVAEKLRQARENREGQRRLIASLNDRTQRRRAEMDSSLLDLPQSQRQPLVERAVASLRGEIKRTTAKERANHVVEATQLAEAAEAIRAHYSSPVQMLMRRDLGSERRSRLQQQIEHSGPVELASLAELAASTKDTELAAVLCARIAPMKAADRPFSSQELADILLGDEHRRIAASLMEIERLAVEAAEDARAFDSGKKSSEATIQVALMKRAEDEVGADFGDQDAA